MFHIFHFLESDMVLRIFNAISSEKRCLISMPFLLTYIVRTRQDSKVFPPA